jgi:hypothetical protein
MQALKERGVDAPAGEPALGSVLVVDRGVDVGVAPHRAQLGEHALGAAHVEQEVVHERNARWVLPGGPVLHR